MRRVSLADNGVRQSQDAPPPLMATPVARLAPELRVDAPADRLFPRRDPPPEMPAVARAAAHPVASGVGAGAKGGFLSPRPVVVHQPVAEAAPPPPAPAQAKTGWFGRRAAPQLAPTPKAPLAVPVARAPAPVSAPARIVAAQMAKPVSRRKPAVTVSGRTNGATLPVSAPSRSSGAGLGQVFTSKLAPARGAPRPANGAGQPTDAGGLGGLFQRMATPPASEAPPTALAATARKRAVKW